MKLDIQIFGGRGASSNEKEFNNNISKVMNKYKYYSSMYMRPDNKGIVQLYRKDNKSNDYIEVWYNDFEAVNKKIDKI